jgi:membrane-bound serine protease (ClpP class)
MTIGILGLLLELYTPGFGVSGIIGVCCLLLFFFGHKIAGLAGWEPMLLFFVGTALLFVEVFLTPGFGLLGSLGVLSVVGALVWTLAGPGGIPVRVSWEAGYLTAALVRVFVAVILVAVLLVAALRFIPRGSGPFRRLVLSAELTGDASEGAHELPEGARSVEALVGRRGVTETALRPTGRARLGNSRIEVESRGAFIEKGAPVEVVEVEGRRVVVKQLKEDKA